MLFCATSCIVSNASVVIWDIWFRYGSVCSAAAVVSVCCPASICEHPVNINRLTKSSDKNLVLNFGSIVINSFFINKFLILSLMRWIRACVANAFFDTIPHLRAVGLHTDSSISLPCATFLLQLLRTYANSITSIYYICQVCFLWGCN